GSSSTGTRPLAFVSRRNSGVRVAPWSRSYSIRSNGMPSWVSSSRILYAFPDEALSWRRSMRPVLAQRRVADVAIAADVGQQGVELGEAARGYGGEVGAADVGGHLAAQAVDQRRAHELQRWVGRPADERHQPRGVQQAVGRAVV